MSRSFTTPPPRVSALDLIPKFISLRAEPEDDPIGVTYLGTPVYSNLIFLAEGANIGNPTTLNPDEGKRDLRIDTVLMTVDQTKNIVKTAIQGRNGTVKEYISDGDYMINIKGAIVSPYPLQYPQDDVDLLIRYMKVNTQIGVASFFLQLFGISDIVIEKYRIAEKLGSRNEVPFEIDAISDTPLEFQLNPNNGV